MPTKHRCFRLAAAFALLVTQSHVARAFVVPSRPGTVQALMDCFDRKIFSSDTPDAPVNVASSLSGEGALLVFITCRDAEDNMHYFVRASHPNRNDVCRAVEEEIFHATASDQIRITVAYGNMEADRDIVLKGWTRSIPQGWVALKYPSRTQEYGFLTESACPRGDDEHYIPLTNVADDVLKSFQSGWSRIVASQQSLEAAITKLPAEYIAIEHFNTPERQQKLRERVIQTVLEAKERPIEYRCETGNNCFASFDSFTIEFAPAPSGIVLTKLLQNWRA